jgi:hypothetical protein
MMLKKLRTILAVNALLILLFVYADYSLGNEFNRYPGSLYSIHWSPFLIQYNLAGSFVNDHWVAVGALRDIVNFPFLLFFASTAVNVLFIILLLRGKDTKQNTT